MKCLIVLSVLAVSCVLAQNYNDGRYYPELYASKFDDGKWRPDNSGAYRGRTGASKTSSKGVGSRFVGASLLGNGFTATSSFGDSFGVASNSGSNNPFSIGGSSSFTNAKKTKTGFVDSSDANKIGIKEDTRQLNEDGSYHYKVVNENDIEVSETGRLDNVGTDDEFLRVMGYYQYLGDDGVLYRVDYVADENGFRPSGAHLPTPPPIPEEILKSLQARGLARK
ncbi:larval cuticle protein LCP-30 [Aedes aegypti]|uniref:Uncharacterized protein n=1 Tax=Aedes aegypti TaxID=7159 RepID=A0A1S4F464_AEDAE|nr:larval cuticle protein LCP-30 [Aedes aegypti]